MPKKRSIARTKSQQRNYSLFVAGVIALACVVAYQGGKLCIAAYREIFPDVRILKTAYPVAVSKDKETHRIVYRMQNQRPKTWVPLRSLPKSVVAAILMSEDASFFQHHGYSPEAIRAAIEYNRKPGIKIKRGGSTITQQVVKNLFLTHEKTMSRKVRELLLAVELERHFSKAKILETYLNIAEWGPGIYGIESASHRYFKKSSAELTPREAATLAFMLPNPGKYQHSLREDGLSNFGSQRVEAILERMWKTGHISAEEAGKDEAEQSNNTPSSDAKNDLPSQVSGSAQPSATEHSL